MKATDFEVRHQTLLHRLVIFKKIEPALFEALATLTKACLESYREAKLL